MFLLFVVGLIDQLQIAADDGQRPVHSFPFAVCQALVGPADNPVDFFCDRGGGGVPFFGQLQRTSVPLGGTGCAGEIALRLKILQRSGECRFILLTLLAKLGGSV